MWFCNVKYKENFISDKIPEAGYCNFENGMCGWYNNETDKGKWVLHRGEDGTNIRTGPTVDHTYRNKTGKQNNLLQWICCI